MTMSRMAKFNFEDYLQYVLWPLEAARCHKPGLKAKVNLKLRDRRVNADETLAALHHH